MLRLSLACERYDRTEALRDGRVTVSGVDLTYLSLPVEETFYRMITYKEFDASEMSLSSYVMSRAKGDDSLIALPVFPSRMFRHSAIYINSDSGITTPKDLIGRQVGVPEFQVSAAVWVRGILEDHYGVPVGSMHYRTGGLHQAGRKEKVPLELTNGIQITPIGPSSTLAQQLVEGEIDALISPRTPQPFREGDPRVKRLFQDIPAEEARFFGDTGLFPIMHVVVLRREVYEKNRWVARSLFESFEKARALCIAGMDETASLRYMLPWLPAELDRTQQVMGKDYWTYGLDRNRDTLTTFLRYMASQGLIATELSVEELFASETLSETLI